MIIIRRMFCCLFYKKSVCLVLLLFLLFCALCKDVNAINTVPLQTSPTTTVNNVELFKLEDINNVVKPDGNNGEKQKDISVKKVTSPFLFAADGLMFAVAEVNNTDKKDGDNTETKIDLMAKYIEADGDDWGDNAITANNNKWKSQLITENVKDIKFAFAAKGAAVTEDKKKIYLLAVNNTSGESDNDNTQWKLKWILGDISNGDGKQQDGNKKISWDAKDVDNSKLVDELKKTFSKDHTKTKILAGGSAFVTKGKKIVFVLQIQQEDSEKKNVIAVLQLKENTDGKAELELLHNEILENCYPYFFQWNEKIMMILTDCKKGEHFVKEFNFNTNKWEESKELNLQSCDFFKNKKDFTAANITGRPALLFTQHIAKDPEKTVETKKDIYLWLSDGNRLHKVGLIIADVNTTSISLLHTSSELFSLYQQWESDGPKNIILTQLKKGLENTTFILDAWNKIDEKIKRSCKEKSTVNVLCATDGLVGFLSNNTNKITNDKEWKDEYYFVNATVTGAAEKVENGFKFSGAGAGAKWQVGKAQKNDQLYNFTDSGFTLVSTVTIGENKREKNNSVLGVALSDNKNNNIVGLWCTTGGKWSVSGNNSQTTPTQNQSCEQGKTYMVTVTLKNDGEGAVYVDGEQVSVDRRDFTVKTGPENSFYFYFGTNEANNDESHVTVTNVLLYNRPLGEEEIKELKIINEEKQEGGEDATKNAQHTENRDKGRKDNKSTGGIDGGDENERTSEDINNNNDREGTSTLQSESSTVRGGSSGVFSLLFLLLLNVSVGSFLL